VIDTERGTTGDVVTWLKDLQQCTPMNVPLILDHLRGERRHAMADLVEGLWDRVETAERKLAAAVKNRKPRKNPIMKKKK
jgi:hypothetical protein